jgi:glyoxylase-like metal-dependent hydrolase (beta-lactamase superfamily II)
MQQPFKVWGDIYIVGSADISHPYDCCIYLIDSAEILLIDSGAGLSFEKIANNIERLGLDPGNIKTVIATHAHIDHIGSLRRFQEKYHAQIMAHELDADAIESGIGVAAEAYGVDYLPCTIDVRLSGDTQTLRLGNHQMNIVHIPGHTPGSVAVYIDIDGKRVLFGQDIHGPYLPEWGADRKLAAASLQKLIDLKADILCEGHFGIYQPAEDVRRYIEYYMDTL